MKRTSLNLLVDLIAAALMISLIATGFVLQFPLPPGTNKSLILWGVSRHGWGTLHFWLSTALLVILLVHVVLHWHWIVSVIGKRLGRSVSERSASKTGLYVAILVAGASFLFAWITYANVLPVVDPLDLNRATSTLRDENGLVSNEVDFGQNTTPHLYFSKDIAPIFERACLICHGPNRAAGDFRVDRHQDYFASSDRGTLVVPGNSLESSIIDIVSGRRRDLPHPNRHVLPMEEVALLKSWIDSGALWREVNSP